MTANEVSSTWFTVVDQREMWVFNDVESTDWTILNDKTTPKLSWKQTMRFHPRGLRYLIEDTSNQLIAWGTTGSPSSSCEMIILRNKSHGDYYYSALRNEKQYGQILQKNTSPYFHSVSLVIWPLTKEPILVSYPFQGLLPT